MGTTANAPKVGLPQEPKKGYNNGWDFAITLAKVWDSRKQRKHERQQQTKQDQDNARHKNKDVGGLSAVAANREPPPALAQAPMAAMPTKNILLVGGLLVAGLAVFKLAK